MALYVSVGINHIGPWDRRDRVRVSTSALIHSPHSARGIGGLRSCNGAQRDYIKLCSRLE